MTLVFDKLAFTHLPKTAGRAAIHMLHAAGAGRPLHQAEHRHISFWSFEPSWASPLKVCGFRRLPEWTWSLMHELLIQRDGCDRLRGVWPNRATITTPGCALSQPWGDMYLMTHTLGFDIDVWLRKEFLAADVQRFAREHLGTDPSEAELKQAALKPPRNNRPHPFSKKELARLYDMNPHWAAREKELYAP